MKKPTVPPNADDPAESQRFIDMAREVEADESPEAPDRAFDRIIPSRPSTKPQIRQHNAIRRKPDRDD